MRDKKKLIKFILIKSLVYKNKIIIIKMIILKIHKMSSKKSTVYKK